VRAANQRSTRLIHDALVGVKCTWKRGRFASHLRIHRSFVGAVVVHDEMHVEKRWNVLVDGVQKPAKLRASVPTMQFSDDLARLYVQSGKQRGSAVSFVIMGSAFDLTRPHGQQWLRAVECLNLRFFIDT
jgi:hypothetical protein